MVVFRRRRAPAPDHPPSSAAALPCQDPEARLSPHPKVKRIVDMLLPLKIKWSLQPMGPAEPAAAPSSPIRDRPVGAISLAHATHHQSRSSDFESDYVGPMSRRSLLGSLAHIEPEESPEKDSRVRLTSLAVAEVPGVVRHACRRLNQLVGRGRGQRRARAAAKPGGEPQMRGKVALITGANQGIGLATAKMFAEEGAEVVMACRSMGRCQAARKTVVAETGNERVSCVECDLSSLRSVATCASTVRRRHEALDYLVLNAGVIMVPFARTGDGFEMHFGVNHLAHFYLTSQLLPLLKWRKGSRVISVSSRAHLAGSVDRIEPREGQGYCRVAAYSSSKLANLLFTRELDRRLLESGVHTRALAVHPGIVATGQALDNGTGMSRVQWALKTPAEGAENVFFAALRPAGELTLGEYIEDEAPRSPSQEALDPEAGAQLWERSAYLIDRAMYT